MSGTDDVFGLFPTPVLRASGVLDADLVAALAAQFDSEASTGNKASGHLSHTAMLQPTDSPLLVEVARRVTPKIVEMGALLFGQRLGWSIKEMWVNVMEPGGMQGMHNHANSFVSGVIYLTPTHEGSQTVFMRASGGTEFIFRNEHASIAHGAFNADRWVSPAPSPGDLLLFPSYLLHAVPPNAGERRITMSFNAIPGGLDAWGYAVKFGA